MHKFQAISNKKLNELNENYLADDTNRIIRNALCENDVATISKCLEAKADNPNFFSIDLKTLPVTNQMASGRCWLFSSLTLLREMVAKKYKIKDQFEFSQNYIAFYDKLEKINYFMESVIAEKDNSATLNTETYRYLLRFAVGDGGQWDMMVALVKKYGLVPKTAMPETYQSSHTRTMNQLINRRLRRFTADMMKAENKEAIAALKDECLKQLYALLCDCFGVPPKTFTFEYYDQKDKYHAHYDVTPMEMYEKYLGVDLDNYVGIINGPTEDKPFYQTYTVKYLGNVAGTDNEVFFLNLPIKDFKDLILKQMKDGDPVWFGCDCGKDSNRELGLWDDLSNDYENTFKLDLEMSKADMLDTLESAMNHAMVFTGVNLVKNKPTRWKIENSWGDKVANKGYYVASDTWFDKYVFEAVVDKKYLNKKQLAAMKKKPVVLDPWDPFGSLAD
ncbi:MAG: C1 family peptidase [Erysipelotrichaceae bacterium]|nr:C1 family peptidase [Erysipelotrichaceae bacterium]